MSGILNARSRFVFTTTLLNRTKNNLPKVPPARSGKAHTLTYSYFTQMPALVLCTIEPTRSHSITYCFSPL